MPPNLGIDLVCILLLSLGTSIAPILAASFILSGVNISVATKETMKRLAISLRLYVNPINYSPTLFKSIVISNSF